jgi:hypothetical protein
MSQPSDRVRIAIGLALLLVSLAYLVQIASPLRLVGDGVDYLMQASSAADGSGFRFHGQRSIRPPGYPALIFLLAKAGLANSWAIVSLNCLLLGIGCWASYFILRTSFGLDSATAEIVCLLTLLSFVTVKHVTLPLSDISYFGFSMPGLLLLLQAEADTRPRRYWQLAAAVPLIGFCIALRTIGVALIPALIWAALGGTAQVKRLPQWLRQHRVVSLVLLLVMLAAIAGAASLFLHSRYLQSSSNILSRRGLGNVVSDLRDHTIEWGELATNAPASKLPGVLQLPMRSIGFFALLLCVAGIWETRRKLDAQVWYVLGFASILLAWPWSDARFWLPVLPLLIGYVLIGARRIVPPSLLRPAILAYSVCFCVLGIVALGYSTRLTFAGSRFPELYGDGSLRATYRLVILGEQPKNTDDISQEALYLLHRYDRSLARK